MKTLEPTSGKDQGFNSDKFQELKKSEAILTTGGNDGWIIMDYSIIDWSTGEETWYTGHGTGGIIWHSTAGLIA